MRRVAILLALLAVPACSGGRVDWNRHDAFRHCAAAIDAWPHRPAPPCTALHMCANEARLSAPQQRVLLQMIRATPGCPPP